ncbi:hypothetical protein ACQEU5_24025 [Marinactinospora thermotolerans]|uniref:Uncharacterized protein n=1 Tax=Marinactinospora thermotolerans DSM 45154 TaxID=1122192 RepID=A0A1T4KAA5_9ACTN|nr:hypothetical protein [Marinactinospora thermotolerans]SJZ39370.1 hypothetical protein SAMN02745673_00269 [Marinactinospora thermotolerans DSM 45154]
MLKADTPNVDKGTVMIVAFILACEAAFWVLLLGGLAARYLLRARRLSSALLLSLPLLDVVLLAAIALHLHHGGTAEFGHGLGALYLGFTVAYGHSMVRWADARFAHRFAGAPLPPRPPQRGWARIRYELVGWWRGILACAIGAGVLYGLTVFAGDPAQTEALNRFYHPLAVFTVINTVVTVWGCLEAGTGRGEPSREQTPDVAGRS